MNAFADQPAAATLHANRALRLSPFDPSAFEAHLALGMAAVTEAKYDDGAACFARALQINPRHSLICFFHASALALAGRAGEADPSVKLGLQLEPGFRVHNLLEYGMGRSLADRLMEGARRLGVPE